MQKLPQLSSSLRHRAGARAGAFGFLVLVEESVLLGFFAGRLAALTGLRQGGGLLAGRRLRGLALRRLGRFVAAFLEQSGVLVAAFAFAVAALAVAALAFASFTLASFAFAALGRFALTLTRFARFGFRFRRRFLGRR